MVNRVARLKRFDLDPVNADAAGIADDLPTGTSWSFTGDAEWVATSAGDGLAHRLIVTTAGNEPAGNAPTLTLVGTDADGRAITDSVVLPNATTVETVKYFATVTSATASAATVGTFDIGWVDEIASPTYPLDRTVDTGALVQLDITGTLDLDVQVTVADIQDAELFSEQADYPWIVTGTTALDGATGDALGRLESNITAMRVIFNSYTDTAEVQVYVSQERN